MDKREYQEKLQEINSLIAVEDYEGAARVADTIDWKRVRNVQTLVMVSEVYEALERYEESKALLLRAYRRSPLGRTVLYRLVECTIKLRQFDQAIEYYSEYVQAAPHDNNKYILKYKIYRARGSSLDEQIDILKEYLDQEYNEKWAYELARLQVQADRVQEGLATCDDLVLWFHSGKYVIKALELKKKYAPLTPKQQEIYDNRFEEEEEEPEMSSDTYLSDVENLAKAERAAAAQEEIKSELAADISHTARLEASKVELSRKAEEAQAEIDRKAAESEKALARNMQNLARERAENAAISQPAVAAEQSPDQADAPEFVSADATGAPEQASHEAERTETGKKSSKGSSGINVFRKMGNSVVGLFSRDSSRKAEAESSTREAADSGQSADEDVRLYQEESAQPVPAAEEAQTVAADIVQTAAREAAQTSSDPEDMSGLLQAAAAGAASAAVAGTVQAAVSEAAQTAASDTVSEAAAEASQAAAAELVQDKAALEESAQRALETSADLTAEAAAEAVSEIPIGTVPEVSAEAVSEISAAAAQGVVTEAVHEETAPETQMQAAQTASEDEVEEEPSERTGHSWAEVMQKAEPVSGNAAVDAMLEIAAEAEREAQLEAQNEAEKLREPVKDASVPEQETSAAEAPASEQEITAEETPASRPETAESEASEPESETFAEETPASMREAAESETSAPESETSESKPEASAAEMSESEESESETLPEESEDVDYRSPEERQADMVRSMREIVAGVGPKEQMGEDEAVLDETIEQSKEDQENAVAARGADMTFRVPVSEASQKRTAGKLTIDDILLSMSDGGNRVREVTAGGVMSASEEAEMTAEHQAEAKANSYNYDKENPGVSAFPKEDVREAVNTRELPVTEIAEADDAMRAAMGLESRDRAAGRFDDDTSDGTAAGKGESSGRKMDAASVAAVGMMLGSAAAGSAADSGASDASSGAVGGSFGEGASSQADDGAAAEAAALLGASKVSYTKEIAEAKTRRLPVEEIRKLHAAYLADSENAAAEAAKNAEKAAEKAAEMAEAEVATEEELLGMSGAKSVAEGDEDVKIAKAPGKQTAGGPQSDFGHERQGEAGYAAGEAGGKLAGDGAGYAAGEAGGKLAGDDDVYAAGDGTGDAAGSAAGYAAGIGAGFAAGSSAGKDQPDGVPGVGTDRGAGRGQTEKFGEQVTREVPKSAPEPQVFTGRAYLKESQMDLFRGFTSIGNLSEQIASAIWQAEHRKDDRTSRSGNILILGAHGCGKTTIATGIAKAIAEDKGTHSVKMARIYAADLNRKDIAATIAKIAGGVLIVEEAGDLDDAIVDQLTTAMEFRTDGMIMILEDEQRYVHDLLMRHPRFTMKFTAQIYIPEYTADDLVNFGRIYAESQDYVFSEKAIEACAARIETAKKNSEAVSVTNVIELVDHAIKNANTFLRRIGSAKKRYDDQDRVILREKDFR